VNRNLLGALALIVLGMLAWQLRWVLLILFGAITLGVALDVPTTLLMHRCRLGRGPALLLVVALLLGLGYGLGQVLVPELAEQVNQLRLLAPEVAKRLAEVGRNVDWFPNVNRELESFGSWERLQPLGGQLLGLAGGAANSTVQVLLMALLALLFCLDPSSHRRLLIALTPSFWRGRMAALLDRCREALGGWLAGMTLSAFTVFLLTWAGLAILRVPLALLSGLLCGLLTFVPTVGPTAATLLPLAVALLVSPARVLQVLVLRLILQNVEAFLLTPLLLRRTVNLLPTVALLAQLSLGALLGLPGLLLALPLVVVLQVICEQVLVHDVMDRWT
jgi:predicted PurR-regulated permease PerM